MEEGVAATPVFLSGESPPGQEEPAGYRRAGASGRLVALLLCGSRDDFCSFPALHDFFASVLLGTVG